MDKDYIQQMAWNEPGGSGDKDPWGGSGRSGGNTPPDLDKALKKFKDRFGGMGGKLPGGLGLIIIGAVILWLLTGIYIVDPAERGVELRFGKHTDTTGPGPHWHLPYPIETVEIVDITKNRDEKIGYRDGLGSRGGGDVLDEALMLTGDENIVKINIAIQYRIKEPEKYLFNLVNPSYTLQEVAVSAIRDVVGKTKLEDILAKGKQEIVEKVHKKAQSILDYYKSGLLITSVNLKDAQPPNQVRGAFADVNKATEDKQRFINQAEAYRNDIIPKARGLAARIVADANGYREQVVAKAEGEASRFSQILSEYTKAPEVTRERMYLETMEQVLGRTGKLIMDENNKNLMLMPLDKMLSSGAPAFSKNKSSDTSDTNVLNPQVRDGATRVKREVERRTRSLREGR